MIDKDIEARPDTLRVASNARRWLTDGSANPDPTQCECRYWAGVHTEESLSDPPMHHPKCVEGLAMWTNDCDYVIAFDAADADAVCKEECGFSAAEDAGGSPDEIWERVPDTETWTLIHQDEPGEPRETRTAAEWVRIYGRQYHSCTEY